MPQLYQILTDFENCFTARIRRKFAIILSLKIPPHLRRFLKTASEVVLVMSAGRLFDSDGAITD